LAVFQKLDQNNQMLWLGFAASENDLLGQIDKEIYMVDFIDLSIAVAGALLILLFMAKRGLLRQSVSSQPEPLIRLREYISGGEGPKVEFKSTIRTNLQTGKRGKEIEFAWLKAVTAFLNSDGGTLLLGVADSGEICGIGADEFENNDRCLLHVKNLLNQHIGAEFSSYIFTTILDCSEGSAVMLECRPAGAAVFLKIGKNEEFYVRSGPSSTKLSPSQTLSYMAEKKS
ncbi:MAG: ATP-binding protein, partial [Desulfuromusa sp.]|nr:ATP-binding protein [Desulfuromusa sp.]